TRLKFTDANTARKRLVLLHRRKILDRFRDGVRPGSEAWRYTLGPVGAVIVAATRGTSTPRPAAHADRVLRLARSPRLHHLLGINEFFVALAATAHRDPGYALTWWLNEKRATAVCAGAAHPDGLGTWTHHRPRQHGGERSVTFFLEHDTGTESLHRLVAKLPGYAEARLADGPDHPVLFWLPSAEREEHLHRLLERARPTVMVATAVHGARPLHQPVPSGADPAGPVWRIPGLPGRHPLIDLAVHLHRKVPMSREMDDGPGRAA
ncbi:MAG TPA: replication-relaxation family protein, partial [Kineosporiaceae bacterium]